MEEKYKKFLSPDEKILQVMGYAKAELVWDLTWGFMPVLVVALLIGLNVTSVIIALLIGAYFIFSGLYKKLTLVYLVTNKRVILKKGLIGQSTVSADYSRITDVTVKQGILGRVLLHTGTILLNTAGGDVEELELKWIQNPFESKDVIYESLHKK